MSFGFGALPGFANMRPEDIASLFSPAQSGVASQGFGVMPQVPAGFSGSATRGIAPFGSLPAPQVAMDEAETRRMEAGMMPAAPLPVRVPAAPIRQASLPPAEAASAGGGMANPPLPPPRPPEFGSGAGAAPAQSAMPAAAGEPPSMMDRFLSGIKGGLGGIDSDLLMGLGIGLMSQRGFGPSAAAGLQMGTQMQNSRAARDLAGAKQAVELQKLRQAQGNTAQMASLIQKQNPSLSTQEAMALAANPAYANKAAEALLPPSEQFVQEKDAAGNLIQRNTRTGQTTMLQAAKDGGFTIGENQVRYNDQGQVVAQGAGIGTDKAAREREERRQAVIAEKQDPSDTRWRDYIISGVLPKENQQLLTAGDKKAIMDGEDTIQSHTNTISQLRRALDLSKKAYEGAGANARALVATNLPGFLGGGSEEALATREFGNVVTGQALDSLKATFGGAPTEGERKILLDVQGAADQPRALREQIIGNAIAKVEQKLRFEQQRVNDLRGGSYYKPGGGAPAGGATPAGPVRVSSPEEARRYKSGTPIILPDGSEGVVP